MTLSALRTKPQFRLASLHVRAHQDGHCEFNLLPRVAQLNVLADELASEVLADLRAADQPTEFYPSACRVYLRDGAGQITSCEKGHSRTNSHRTKSERTSKSATVGPHTHLIPSIGLHIEQQFLHSVRTFLIKLVHDYSYQLALGNAETALRLSPARNAFNSKQYVGCTSATLEQIGVTNSSISLRNTSKTHPLQLTLRCTIVEGIQKWFLTDDMNDSDEPEPTTQLSWYQVIKGYLPNQWSRTQAKLSATKDSTQETKQVSDGRAN
jgi:hypothetical protein